MVVAEGELFRKREVIRNVLFAVLLLHCICRPPQPRAMIVSRVAPGGWVLRRGEVCPVRARKTPEVVVKAVVFLNDDHDVCDGIVRLHGLFEDLRKPGSAIWIDRQSHLAAFRDTTTRFSEAQLGLPKMLSFPGLSIKAHEPQGHGLALDGVFCLSRFFGALVHLQPRKPASSPIMIPAS